jgi:hypothetical protein
VPVAVRTYVEAAPLEALTHLKSIVEKEAKRR